MKGQAVMFGRATDEWETPRALFDRLDKEFYFELDAAAEAHNAMVPAYLGPDSVYPARRDALTCDWSAVLDILRVADWRLQAGAVWLNPPYSKCRQFIEKVTQEVRKGATVVCLVPSRTDTRWWHSAVWDESNDRLRPGVEIRFLKGRLKFGDSKNSAPFPSVVIIFRPVQP
jgi:site-specific DNA-methyltransferase (adenine-specific)